jgi:hypothetical protein
VSVLDRLRPGIRQVAALRLFDYGSAGPALVRLDCNELCLPPSEAELSAITGVHVYPSDANFLLVRTAHPASQVERRLLAESVIVKNVARPGLLDGCLRITVGTPEENRRLVAALRAALGSRTP